MIPPDYVQRHPPTRASRARARLELLVLEGGQAFLVRARDALVRGDVGGFVADLARTQDVVVEIAETADARGTDVAARLASLRALMLRRLAHADAGRSVELVDELLEAYGGIVETYRELVRAGG